MSDKVKTIIFSELPKNDKVKYLQFLIENDINFTKDDNGNYVALIKVLNPSVYEKDINKEKASIQNSLKHSNNQVNDNINENVNARKEAQVQSTKKKLSSSMVKVKSIGKKKENRSSSISKVDNMIKPTNSLEYLKSTYPEFMKLINPILGVRPMKMNYYQLKYQIEELYTIKFMIDTVTIKNKLNSKLEDDTITEPFQKFIVDYKTEKLLKKQLIDKNILDILLSADFYKERREIETFLSFISNEYDSDDLIFYLFVRTCIEKEMKVMLMEKAREEVKLQHSEGKEFIDTEIYINYKTCLRSKYKDLL